MTELQYMTDYNNKHTTLVWNQRAPLSITGEAEAQGKGKELPSSPLSPHPDIIGRIVSSITPSTALGSVPALLPIIEQHGVVLLRNMEHWAAR